MLRALQLSNRSLIVTSERHLDGFETERSYRKHSSGAIDLTLALIEDDH